MFTLFEGANSTGKSTKIQEYSAKLTAENIEHDVVCETSGDPISEEIRSILMKKILPVEIEILLFNFLRYETYKKKFKKKEILCDRGYISTLVFQCCLPVIAKKKGKKSKDNLEINQVTKQLINIFYSNNHNLEPLSSKILSFVCCNMHHGESILSKFLAERLDKETKTKARKNYFDTVLNIMEYFILSQQDGEKINKLIEQNMMLHDYLELPYPDKVILVKAKKQFTKDKTDDDYDNDFEIFNITSKLYELICE